MRKFLLVLSLFITTLSQAQLNQWTWMHGADTAHNEVPSGGPRIRDAAASWTDKDGNLWLFGGGYDANFMEHFFRNDLWKFDISTNQWTFIKSGDRFGHFGEQGIPGSGNVPPARRDAVSWTDRDGQFWLFGGNGNAEIWEDVLNDLWKFDPATLMWTWMGGFGGGYVDGAPVYGAKGEASPEYWPGATANGTGWADAEGNLWLLGGAYGEYHFWKYDTRTSMWAWMGSEAPYGGQAMGGKSIDGALWLYSNNLWKYDIQNDTWTNLGSKAPSYGTKGEASISNWPAPRGNAHFWIGKEGRIWLFGGGVKTTYSFYPKYGYVDYIYNDLWTYDINKHEWTWMGGDNTINQPGVYGNPGQASPHNKPGARLDGVNWVDQQGNLWLYGGNGDFTYVFGYNESGIEEDFSNEYYTDVWKYTLQLPEITLSCPASVTVNTDAGVCAALVHHIDPVLAPAGTATVVNYTLSGATTRTGTGSASGQSFNKGVTTVTYALANNPAKSCSFTVTVNDAEAPSLTAVKSSTSTLWPTNHKMVDISLQYSSSDNCGVTKTEVTVTSNEPPNGLGDGDTDHDWEVINHQLVRLRAARSGNGNGRTYTITVTVWDAAGNQASRSTTVAVPKNMSAGNNGKGIAEKGSVGMEQNPDGLNLKVLPNPSASSFTLLVQSKEKAPVSLTIFDASGRVLEIKNKLAGNSSLTIGHHYRPGVYYAELIQGDRRVSVKLVKKP